MNLISPTKTSSEVLPTTRVGAESSQLSVYKINETTSDSEDTKSGNTMTPKIHAKYNKKKLNQSDIDVFDNLEKTTRTLKEDNSESKTLKKNTDVHIDSSHENKENTSQCDSNKSRVCEKDNSKVMNSSLGITIKNHVNGDHTETEMNDKIDALLLDTYSDSEYESDIEENSFIDGMAEEGEEDTPSDDSNEIIDEGEAINTTESEFEDDESYENDSFIDDDENHELLSGDEYDLSIDDGKKRSRIIQLNVESDEDIIKMPKICKKKVLKKKKSRIIRLIDSSDEEDETGANEIEEKLEGERISFENVEDLCPKENGNDLLPPSSPSKCEEPELKKNKIIILENIRVQDISDKELSEHINNVIGSFCPEFRKTPPKISDVIITDADCLPRNENIIASNDQDQKRRRRRNKKKKNKKKTDVVALEDSENNVITSEEKENGSCKESPSKSKNKKKRRKRKKKNSKVTIGESPMKQNVNGFSDLDFKDKTQTPSLKFHENKIKKRKYNSSEDLRSNNEFVKRRKIDDENKKFGKSPKVNNVNYEKITKSDAKDFRNFTLYADKHVKRMKTTDFLRKKL